MRKLGDLNVSVHNHLSPFNLEFLPIKMNCKFHYFIRWVFKYLAECVEVDLSDTDNVFQLIVGLVAVGADMFQVLVGM